MTEPKEPRDRPNPPDARTPLSHKAIAQSPPSTEAHPASNPAPPSRLRLAIPEQLSWFLLLLPGFILVSVMGVVTERPEWTELEFSAFSLLGSALCLALTFPLYLGGRFVIRRVRRRARQRIAKPPSLALPVTFVVVNFLLAACLGGAIGLALDSDASIRAVNAALGVEIDKRSWQRPLKYVLGNNGAGALEKLSIDGRILGLKQPNAYVRFAFKEGTSYEGWPKLLPRGNARTEIFLSPACRRGDKDVDFVLIQGPGVLLPLDEYDSIELIDRAASACFAQVKEQAICASCPACFKALANGAPGAGSAACKTCGAEAEGLATSTLIDVQIRELAKATATSCGLDAQCAPDDPSSPACKDRAACLDSAKQITAQPRCQ